jgi:hypothetical protein
MTRVHGGFANRMYRLDTDHGSFAVKERRSPSPDAAGSMPTPLALDELSTRWDKV